MSIDGVMCPTPTGRFRAAVDLFWWMLSFCIGELGLGLTWTAVYLCWWMLLIRIGELVNWY